MATKVEDKPVSNDSKIAKTNDVEDADAESPTKKSKLEENTPGKKSGRKKRSDTDMIAEAKALYGELDTSGGRSLRRRSEPKPVEEKKKPTPRRASKKKDSEKETAEEAKDKPEENDDKEEAKNGDEGKNKKEETEDKPQNNDEKSDKATTEDDKHKDETKTD
ncbi:hypothetical protein HELRODRAFT_170160 [Helobdella robusta]|uniref:Uncharacterized protein n=1 Tax=Helobdella robusta TaxID=6412 RepID=T1F2Q4_HELRO|nr:hypothetical protein HELRODRAFT_170160 [Helobdella robusta]ESO07616.1 hypothetical protein HELRODRAFT_170160 [Helobdella robusta]